MKVVNPVGREADDVGSVNSACRCSLKGEYVRANVANGCSCNVSGPSGSQISHIVTQGH